MRISLPVNGSGFNSPPRIMVRTVFGEHCQRFAKSETRKAGMSTSIANMAAYPHYRVACTDHCTLGSGDLARRKVEQLISF
jgi:hypothetical protein